MAERVWRQGKRADTPVKVGEVDENVFRMLIWFQEAVRSSFDACEAAVKVQIPAHVSSARVELERLGSGDLIRRWHLEFPRLSDLVWGASRPNQPAWGTPDVIYWRATCSTAKRSSDDSLTGIIEML